jgi:hypothetical protein
LASWQGQLLGDNDIPTSALALQPKRLDLTDHLSVAPDLYVAYTLEGCPGPLSFRLPPTGTIAVNEVDRVPSGPLDLNLG